MDALTLERDQKVQVSQTCQIPKWQVTSNNLAMDLEFRHAQQDPDILQRTQVPLCQCAMKYSAAMK